MPHCSSSGVETLGLGKKASPRLCGPGSRVAGSRRRSALLRDSCQHTRLPGAGLGYTVHSQTTRGPLPGQQSLLGISQLLEEGSRMAVYGTRPTPGGDIAIETRICWGPVLTYAA